MPAVRGISRYALALVPTVLLATNGCRAARGAQVANGAGTQAPAGQGTAPDPLDRALDRVDAARARLTAADAQAAAAMRELDAALDDVSKLGGDNRTDSDCCRDFGTRSWDSDRIAWRAERNARQAVLMSQRAERSFIVRVHPDVGRSVAITMPPEHWSSDCPDEGQDDNSSSDDQDDDSSDEGQ